MHAASYQQAQLPFTSNIDRQDNADKCLSTCCCRATGQGQMPLAAAPRLSKQEALAWHRQSGLRCGGEHDAIWGAQLDHLAPPKAALLLRMEALGF